MARRLCRGFGKLVRGGCRLIPALLRDQSGSPGIEFALVAPLMFTLLAGSYDATQIFIAMRRVTSTAQEVVQIATEQAVQPDQSNALTVDQAKQAMTAIYAIIPGLKSGADTSQFSVTLSGIVYTAIPAGCVAGSGCTYVGDVKWSVALAQGLQVTRCGVVAQVATDQQVTLGNLPTSGMTTLTSVAVADVSYTYQPLFSRFITGPVTLQRTAFLPPRAGKSTDYVHYDKDNPLTNTAVCQPVSANIASNSGNRGNDLNNKGSVENDNKGSK